GPCAKQVHLSGADGPGAGPSTCCGAVRRSAHGGADARRTQRTAVVVRRRRAAARPLVPKKDQPAERLMTSQAIGISGFAIDLPPYRVKLEDWCEWTGNSWDKVKSVVGRSFRMLAPNQTVYALAANAVLKLIDQYEVDPAAIGYLGL